MCASGVGRVEQRPQATPPSLVGLVGRPSSARSRIGLGSFGLAYLLVRLLPTRTHPHTRSHGPPREEDDVGEDGGSLGVCLE